MKIIQMITGGVVCLIAAAANSAELPTTTQAPSGESFLTREVTTHQTRLGGKVIEIKFNRIYSLKQTPAGFYKGYIRCREQYSGGCYVEIPRAGIGFFQQFMPADGNDTGDLYTKMTKLETGVYVLIPSEDTSRLIALGDKFSKNDDGTVSYKWSKEAEVPDLDEKGSWTVSELVLFGYDLEGKIIEVLFCIAPDGLRSDSDGGGYHTWVSSGFGLPGVLVNFPSDGLPLFEDVVKRGADNEHETSVFARVGKMKDGNLKLDALGRRRRGKGDDAEYKW